MTALKETSFYTVRRGRGKTSSSRPERQVCGLAHLAPHEGRLPHNSYQIHTPRVTMLGHHGDDLPPLGSASSCPSASHPPPPLCPALPHAPGSARGQLRGLLSWQVEGGSCPLPVAIRAAPSHRGDAECVHSGPVQAGAGQARHLGRTAVHRPPSLSGMCK